MAEYGLGNFVYELNFDGKSANFKFRDPEDVNNVAEVSVPEKDFPEGINQPDSREVADVAYGLVAKALNDKRDKRLKDEAKQAAENQKNKEASDREVANDFFNKSEELGNTTPTGEVPAGKSDIPAPKHTSEKERIEANSIPDDSKSSQKNEENSKKKK